MYSCNREHDCVSKKKERQSHVANYHRVSSNSQKAIRKPAGKRSREEKHENCTRIGDRPVVFCWSDGTRLIRSAYHAEIAFCPRRRALYAVAFCSRIAFPTDKRCRTRERERESGRTQKLVKRSLKARDTREPESTEKGKRERRDRIWTIALNKSQNTGIQAQSATGCHWFVDFLFLDS